MKFGFFCSDVDLCWDVGFEPTPPEAAGDGGAGPAAGGAGGGEYTLAVQVRFQELDPTWLRSCPRGNASAPAPAVDRIDITAGETD